MKQLVIPNLKQQALAGNCAEFVFLALGGRNGWGFRWARQAWDGQANKYPGQLPPAGFYSLLWFDHWGTYQGVYRNWGHVCFQMPDGRILSSPYQSGRYGQSILSSIAEVERLYNSKYLGWSASLDGTLVLDVTATPSPTPTGQEEDEDMAKNSGTYYERKSDKAIVFVVSNLGSGHYHEMTNGNPGVLLTKEEMARYVAAYDLAGAGFFLTTESEANALSRACTAVRQGK